MAVTTVAQLAAELNRPVATLLEQLRAAGVAKGSSDDSVIEADKNKLLDHLRTVHGSAAPAERKKIEDLHLMGILQPAEIADFAVYLASDKAKRMTGGIHVVDAGYTAFKGRMDIKAAVAS